MTSTSLLELIATSDMRHDCEENAITRTGFCHHHAGVPSPPLDIVYGKHRTHNALELQTRGILQGRAIS